MYLFEKAHGLDRDKEFAKHGLILQPSQVISRLVFQGLDADQPLIFNYTMGTGKTLASLNCIRDYIKLILRSRVKLPTRIIVVGSWTVEDAFKRELERPYFKTLRADKPSQSAFLFMGYKVLFNRTFSVDYGKYGQDTDLLLNDIASGKVSISDQIKEILTDSVLIVDEFQNLYSRNGMNSYGVVIETLLQSSIPFRTILLSGTLFNASVGELVEILNLTRKRGTPRYLRDMLIRDEITKENIMVPRLISSKPPPELCSHILSIPPKDRSGDRYPNTVFVSNFDGITDLKLFKLEMEGYQAMRFSQYLEINIGMQQLIDESTTNLTDIAIPEKLPAGTYYNDGIYSGTLLKHKHLRNYSIRGARVIEAADQAVEAKEKSFFYHGRVEGFALRQYYEILISNGYIPYGERPMNNSRCWKCGKSFLGHTTKDHSFIGRYIGMIFGPLGRHERSTIIDAFNAPKNLYGQEMCILLASQVARTGMTLQNVSQLHVFSQVPSLSQLNQIIGRTSRLDSHKLLPKEKRIVKIFVYINTLPGEAGKGLPPSKSENYYRQQEILFNDVLRLQESLYKECIGTKLFKDGKVNLFEPHVESRIYMEEMIHGLRYTINTLLAEGQAWSVKTLLDRARDSRMTRCGFDLSGLTDTEALGIFKEMQIPGLHHISEGKDVSLKSIVRITERTAVDSLDETYVVPFQKIYRINQHRILQNIEALIDGLKTVKSYVNAYKMLYDIISAIKIEIPDGDSSEGLKPYAILRDKTDFWDVNYKIHNTYYEGDELSLYDFCRNHTANDKSKLAGCYYGSNIILRDGSLIPITSRPITFTGELNQKCFMCAHAQPDTQSVWHLHLKVLDLDEEESALDDKRKRKRGISCTSFQSMEIVKVFGLGDKMPRLERCIFLMEYVIAQQLEVLEEAETQSNSSPSIFVSTPFQMVV